MATQSSKLMVGVVGGKVSTQELEQEFSRFGSVKSAAMIGQNTFMSDFMITMSTPEEAVHAANVLDGTKVLGQVLEVVVDKDVVAMVHQQHLLAGKLNSGPRYGRSRQSCDF